MSWTSYSQNFEDVMLWRALKRVEQGCYIDVGANSPVVDSVTKHFYDQGWSGINIEPEPELHAMLEQDRPRDINLKVAISDFEGEGEIYYCVEKGLSTLDKAIADSNKTQGFGNNISKVFVTTLKTVCEDHIGDGEVHFLKVDAEGLEEKVLFGNDWTKIRPWIVVVEAMLPNTQIEDHHKWEGILLDASYKFAYADGLNRFYVAKEHGELIASFKYPPNVFDDFKVYEPWANKPLLETDEPPSGVIEDHPLKKFWDWFIIGSYHWITLSPTSRPRRVLRKLREKSKRTDK